MVSTGKCALVSDKTIMIPEALVSTFIPELGMSILFTRRDRFLSKLV